jgi:hypothetical protein
MKYLFLALALVLPNFAHAGSDPFADVLAALAPAGYADMSEKDPETIRSLTNAILEQNLTNYQHQQLYGVPYDALEISKPKAEGGFKSSRQDAEFRRSINITNTSGDSAKRQAAVAALKKLLEHILLVEKKGVGSELAGRVARALYEVMPQEEALAFVESVKQRIPTTSGVGSGPRERPAHGL